MVETDIYVKVFNELKKRDEQRNPFLVLVSVEHEITITQIQNWKDLVTGEEKETRTKVFTKEEHRTVPWNPFTKKGPYFLNTVGHVIDRFLKKEQKDG